METNIQTAKRLLEADEVVAIPTETVYGLAGNALSNAAIVKIFAVKERPFFDPLIVHGADFEHLTAYVQNIPATACELARHFMPGPLTLLLERRESIPDLITAGSPWVGLRAPAHPLTHELLKQLDFPLAAPSANPFGYISPTTAAHVAQQLGDKIPYILDGGACTVGVESTIIGFPNGKPTVYRKGGLAIETLENIIGPVEVLAVSSSNPQAPGMLKSHYAPRIPLILGNIPEMLEEWAGKKVGILSFSRQYTTLPSAQQVTLSPNGVYAEAAQKLFSGMRYLDQLDIDVILAELLPEKDLGRAINDRLRRAASDMKNSS